LLPNFIPIRFEAMEPWAFLQSVAPTTTTTTTITRITRRVVGMESGIMESVPYPKTYVLTIRPRHVTALHSFVATRSLKIPTRLKTRRYLSV